VKESEKTKLIGFIVMLTVIAVVVKLGVEEIKSWFHRPAAIARQPSVAPEAGGSNQPAGTAASSAPTSPTAPAIATPKTNRVTQLEQTPHPDATGVSKRPEQPPAPHIKTPEELAAEHEAYLAKYLSIRPHREPAVGTVAIAVVSDGAKFNEALAAAVGERIKPDGVKVLPRLFTPEFVSDGLFTKTFSGSTEGVRGLDLTNFVDSLLCGREVVEYSTNSELQTTISAHLRLELTSFRITAAGPDKSWTFAANGVGFRQGDALALAEDRLLKQIARTNFDMGQFPQLEK